MSRSEQSLSIGAWPADVPDGIGTLLADAAITEAIERLDPETLGEWRESRLTAMLQFLHARAPWWRDRLIESRAAKRLSDLLILSREAFRTYNEVEAEAVVLPASHGRRIRNATSGSSGVPTFFYTTDLHQRMVSAYNFLDERRQGRPLDDAVAVILTRCPESDAGHRTERRYPALGRGVSHLRRTPQFTAEQHARWLSTIKPDHLCTIPSMLDAIVRACETGAAAPCTLKQVFTHGETVTPNLRARTRAVFGASIRDRYACEEVGPIAFQCPHSEDHYHVAAANALVEIIDDAGRNQQFGEPGRVLVTGLSNWASPAIRYELNDIASLLPSCPCGFQHATLTHLLGRRRYLLRLPSGEHMVCNIQAGDWLPIAPFRETRLVQVAPERVLAEVVLNRPITDEERFRVMAMLSALISPSIEYDVKQVDQIAWAPTYKRQEFVSLL